MAMMHLKERLPTAVNYYSKILDDTTILAELVLPYEVQIVNLKSKILTRYHKKLK